MNIGWSRDLDGILGTHSLSGPGKQVQVDGDPSAPSPVPAIRTPGIQYGLLMPQCEDESSQSVAE